MGKPVKRCKERDAHFYWNQTDEQDRCFFKVLAGDFRERLAIPDKFVQHFSGRIAKTVKLESRSGYTFDVEITNNLGKLVLQRGWKAFVSAHDLKMGDFLVFMYDGASRLKVLIFDLSCCEKVLPCVVKNSIRREGRREERIEISSSCDNLPVESPESKRKAWKKMEGSKIVNISSSSSASNSSGNLTSPEDQEPQAVPSYILPQRTCLTGAQKKKLKEKVRAIHSKIPIYGCVMTKISIISGKYQTMDISRKYADAYLPFEKGTVMLHRHGKSWEVRCNMQAKLRSKRLSKGWKQFALDNNLQLGDLCLFELVKNRKCTMIVHVIREK